MPIELGSAYGKIIIDSSGVRRGTGEAKKEINEFSKTFSAASKSIVTTTGLITGEIAILKKVFDFGREGAVVVQTKESFDRLLGSLGAAPDLLDRMQEASGGTVAAMRLQSATTTLLAGTSQELGRELADNAVGILEIAKAANKLNPSLGSTEFLYQSLMTGIKRGSPMIIDNTGITLKLGEAYEALATELGKSADELTSEEQKMAILRATMEAGDRIIQQVGGTTDAATDNFDRMTAAIIDQAEKIKAFWLPPLRDAADAVYYLVSWEDQLGKLLVQHESDLRKGAGQWDIYIKNVVRAAVANGTLTDAQAKYALQLGKTSGNFDELSRYLGKFGVEITKSTGTWEDYIRELGRAGKASRLFTEGEADAGVAMALNTGKVNDLTAYYGLAGVELEILTEDQYKWVAAAANGTIAVQTYGDGLVDAATKAGAFADAMPRLTGSMEELELFMAGPLGEEMDAFYKREGDLQKEADALNGEIEELSGKTWLSKAQKEQLEENKKKLEEIQGQIKTNADEHEKATKRILFDLLQQQLAMDGLTAEEGAALAVVAEKWGLVDEETATAYKKIQDYVQQARDGKITVEELAAAIEKLGDKDIYLTTHFIETYQKGAAPWKNDGGEGSTVEGFASGGMMVGGRPAIVGEDGIELLIPNSNSTVVSNDQVRQALAEAVGAGQAGGGDTILQFYLQAEGAGAEDMESLAWRTSEIVMAKLAR